MEHASELNLITAAETARLLKVSVRTLYNLRDRLPIIQIGRHIRYAVADIKSFVERGKSSCCPTHTGVH